MDGMIRQGRGVYFFAVRLGRVLDVSLGADVLRSERRWRRRT